MSNKSVIMQICEKIQINRQIKKLTPGKIILQWVVTIAAILSIWGIISFTIMTVAEQNTTDDFKWRLGDLNEGDYAACVDVYSMQKYLGETTDKKYAQFEEFKQFYMQYILCVEYGKAEHPEQYQDRLQECLETMQQICRDSPYAQNIPHYQYLLENAVVVDENHL